MTWPQNGHDTYQMASESTWPQRGHNIYHMACNFPETHINDTAQEEPDGPAGAQGGGAPAPRAVPLIPDRKP